MVKEDSSWCSVSSGEAEAESFAGLSLSSEQANQEANVEDASTNSTTLQENASHDLMQVLQTEQQESKQDFIKILQAILRTELLLDNLEECNEHDVTQTMNTLVSGSKKINLKELKDKAVKFAKTVMERKDIFAVPVLACCDIHNDSLQDTGLKELALEAIRLNPKMLLNGACALLNTECLEGVLSLPDMKADDYTKFQILENWTQSASDFGLNLKEHQTMAAKLSKHIDLAGIDQELLCLQVRNSSFITDTQLVDAFTKQVACLEEKQKQTGAAVVWKTSKNDIFRNTDRSGWNTDSVVGRVMKSGVHKWSFTGSNTSMVGITSASQPLNPSQNIGIGSNAKNTCGYYAGCMYSFGTSSALKYVPTVKSSSTVSFTLSLLGGHQNRLEMSVDGGRPRTLAEGSTLDNGGNGFVPVASLAGGCSIRFLGFDDSDST